MSINSRIRSLRKDKGWNQCHLASLLGVTQPGISYMEQDGSTVSEQTIKSLCLAIPGLNEDWLRHGIGSMYNPVSTFSLDEFVRDHGGTELEIEIVKAYFGLPTEIRSVVLEQFKQVFTQEQRSATPEPTVEQLEAEYKKMYSKFVRNKESSVSNSIDDNASSTKVSDG